MRFEAIERQELADGVAEQIRRAILSGAFAAGSSLPSERELSTQFEVNRSTLREALHELEQQGLIERRQGARCRVLDYRRTASLALIRHLVDDPGQGEFDPKTAGATVEAVRILYVGAAELAAKRHTEADRAALEQALADLEAAVEEGDAAKVVSAERDFHRTVVHASHNIALELTVNDFYRALEGSSHQRVAVRLAERGIARLREGPSPYRALYRAVSQGETDEAFRTARALMRFQVSLAETRQPSS